MNSECANARGGIKHDECHIRNPLIQIVPFAPNDLKASVKTLCKMIKLLKVVEVKVKVRLTLRLRLRLG
jgi:hypothetical protein